MDSTAVERVLRLPPRADSPGEARRVLRQVLAGCGQEQWRDAAELAVTELVTNVVIHARTELELRVSCDDEGLHVAVEDFSLAVPAQRQYRVDATTGRGLALVAAVASAHGITPTSTGKTVWFTVTDAPAGDAEDDLEALLDAWGDDDLLPAADVEHRRSVGLVGLPPTLWLAAAQQHDALLRELTLFRSGQGQPTDDVAAADRARSAVRTAVELQLARAKERGLAVTPLPKDHPAPLDAVPPVVDVTVSLDAATPADFTVLQDVLDEAQRLAHAGQLLVQPALPEVVAVRDWLCEQVVAVDAGLPAHPWQGADAEHFAQAVDHAARQVDYDTAAVVGGERTAIVVDSHNRIVAISAALAEDIGWQVDDLVGRRVVAIIPPRHREAHTSGFTRHLTTGEAHALGVELQLPVLRADGSEQTFTFWIEADRSRSGRAVYIAYLSRLEQPQPV